MPSDLIAQLAGYEVVVLDGCDGTGKTTIAEAMRTQHGYRVIHSGRTPDGTDIAGRYLAHPQAATAHHPRPQLHQRTSLRADLPRAITPHPRGGHQTGYDRCQPRRHPCSPHWPP
jgi:thymidylate kinase